MESHHPLGTKNQFQETPQHDIILKNRKTVEITGVKHVESFDHEEFLLETGMGFLAVRGANLKMKNLNVDDGIVNIEGKVLDLSYLEDAHGEQAKGIFGKLFK